MEQIKLFLSNAILAIAAVGLCWLFVNGFLYQSRSTDTRPAITVLADEWAKSKDVMYFIAPQNYVRGDIHPAFNNILPNNIAMPLGGVPAVRSIYCQEDEGWYIDRTDRFGFFNPDGAWEKPVDILLVGDSFAQGACTRKNSRFFLAEQANTVTIGSGGNGPLLELAILREFFLKYSAAQVVWYVFENDLSDLALELSYGPLRSYYVDPTYSQHYFEQDLSVFRNSALAAVPGYLEINANNIADSRFKIRSPLQNILTGRPLVNLAFEIAGREPQSGIAERTPLDRNVLAAFSAILARAHALTNRAGSNLTFFFLPSRRSCIDRRSPQFITELMRELEKSGFDYVNAAEEFQKDGCANLFATRAGGHLNAFGYRRLAETIFRHLNFPKSK